jgi:CRISPR/Cas system CMR-associated protein Cmr5 small subunit
LSEWIAEAHPAGNAGNKSSLLKRVIAGDTEFLKVVTVEALAWLQWLKRFCEGEAE